jgi:hypothetical protein
MLNPDGTTPQGYGTWPLPNGKRPGRWLPKIEGDLELCANGYHLLRPGDLLEWLGPELWVAEWRGDRTDGGDDKVVVRQARLLHKVDAYTDRTLRLFACDCAERALTHATTPDPRSVNAIAVARKFAYGEATQEELAAAGDAAWAAAWDAAGDAAWAAAWAAAGDAAWDAAGDAAWAAAWAAAGDAAGDAARAAEKSWQTSRLMEVLGLEG